MNKPTHKYFMNYYAVGAAEDKIFRTNDPEEMLKALNDQYMRTYQPDTIYGVFCFDEETKSWKGFDYEGAMSYLRKIVRGTPLPIYFLYRNDRTLSDPPDNFHCTLCQRGIHELANCLGNDDVKICISCGHDIRNLLPDPKCEVKNHG